MALPLINREVVSQETDPSQRGWNKNIKCSCRDNSGLDPFVEGACIAIDEDPPAGAAVKAALFAQVDIPREAEAGMVVHLVEEGLQDSAKVSLSVEAEGSVEEVAVVRLVDVGWRRGWDHLREVF